MQTRRRHDRLVGMKRIPWFVVAVAITASSLLASACAVLPKDTGREAEISIEALSSRYGVLRFIRVTRDESAAVVRGEVHRRWGMRGPIPGHIDIRIIGPEGVVLESATAGYHRRSVKSTSASFHVALNAMPPAGATVRVVHDVGNVPHVTDSPDDR